MTSKHYWIKVWVITAVTAFIVNGTTRKILSPSDDGNLSAYQVLVAGCESGDYEAMRACAEAAIQISNDADIEKCAGFFLRTSEIAIESGIRTFEENNSFSGFVKGFITAYLNPLVGIKAAIVAVEQFFVKNSFERVDAKYLPLWEQQIFAGKAAFWVAAIVFIAMLLFARAKREQISRWLDSKGIAVQSPAASGESSSS